MTGQDDYTLDLLLSRGIISQEQVEQAFCEAGMAVEAMFEVGDFAHHDLMQAIARKSTWWRWFVLLALLALVGEAAVLRFWK